MKKALLLSAALTFSALQNFATNVSGIISNSTTWTKANSPYIVTGDIDVDTNAVLTIEPGVTIKVDGNYAIYVDGIINAAGTDTDNILFTSNKSNPAMGDWKGILVRRIITTDTLVFDHCHMQYADKAISVYAPVNITNSFFDYNQTGVETQLYAKIISSRFLYNYSLGYCRWGVITDCEIGYNVEGFSAEGTITYNKIYRNGFGISFSDWRTLVAHNVVAYNSTSGLAIGGGTVVDNQVWYNGIGLNFNHNAYTAHNGIKHNNIGIQVGWQNPGIVEYNCIEENNLYNFKNSAVNLMDMSNNYWGASDSATVMTKIFDYYSDFSKGKTILTPLLQSEDSGCAATIDIPTTGIKETAAANDVKVYPNPANTNFFIESPKPISRVILYDITGKQVFVNNSVKNNVSVDVSALTQGLYLYRVYLINNHIVTGKLIKN